MKLTVIDSLEGVLRLRAYLEECEFVAYDTETTGLTKQDRIIGFSLCASEEEAFYIILESWNVAEGKLDPKPYLPEAKELVASLANKKLICHNAVFDCMITEAYFKIKLMPSVHTDTMLLAHLLDENRRVGLKELSSIAFGGDSTQEQKEMKDSVERNGGKLTKTQYEMYKCDSYVMGKYGAKDALLTYKLFMVLVPELFDQGLDDFFYNDESMPLLRGPTYDLNTLGLSVDSAKLLTLKKTLEAECAEAKSLIFHEITPYVQDKYPGTTKTNTFNIGASQQLSWLLFGRYGLEFGTLTKVGKVVCKAMDMKLPYTFAAKHYFIAECNRRKGEQYAPGKKIRDPWAYIAADKKTLEKLSNKHDWVAKLLEYNRKMKLLNTYVKGIEQRVQYGIIQPSFLQHGTTSGRYSSRSPNFQNLPRDDKRIKACIVARPGKVFVGADYSQLEPRVFAYFSKDARLKEAFNGQDDFYSVIGMEVYNKSDCVPRKDGSPDAFGIKYKKLRDYSKVIALASTYGATAHQLAPTTGKSIEDTQLDMDNYFESFPGVAQMMLDAHKQAKDTGMVFSLFGRPRRIETAKKIEKLYGDVPHGELPYEARQLLNLAVNHRIQSTGASIVNRAAIQFYKYKEDANLPCNIVLQVHDSLIVECLESDKEWVAALLEDAMINTCKLEGIPLEAVPVIGKSLAEA